MRWTFRGLLPSFSQAPSSQSCFWNDVPFSRQGKQSLLFVFSTRCGVCTLNWPTWQSIARSAEGRPLRLVYADIQSPMDPLYAKQYGLEKAIVFEQLDPRYEAELNLRLTPLTILLNADGKVMRVWAGLLEGSQLSDLRQTLQLGSS